ncbi:MAG: glycosyltransferase [Lachnospiraceae bacterium]|nr:glycosyltransferase [Lachnospiraceae bacterium]
MVNVPLPGALEGAAPVICGWTAQLAKLLSALPDISLTVCYPQEISRTPLKTRTGSIRHIGFYEPADPLLSYPQWMEEGFRKILKEENPDFLHIWGTEYVHALALFNAFGDPSRVLVSIQGLISVYAQHYMADLPAPLQKKYTLRDFYHHDNLLAQQEKYRIRGEFEKELLAKAEHVAGRTFWDKHYTEKLSPKARYHYCSEILREEFYDEAVWDFSRCKGNSIFCSQFYYPIKGFHKLLEALPLILKKYPGATVRVSGGGIIFPGDIKGKLKQTAYIKYLESLIQKYGLKDKIEFLGNLGPAEMKAEYLKAHVFVLPSAIENSPNSLGEAMILGTPAVSAEVGGVKDMLPMDEQLYPFENAALLAEKVCRIFDMGEGGITISEKEKELASRSHAPDGCLEEYLTAYAALCQ